jgi:transposase
MANGPISITRIAAVRVSGTMLAGIFGAGPVAAATAIGAVRDMSRCPDRDHFAANNGTAPIEVSSGHRKIYRLSRRGNRRLNHVIHMAAVTQIRYRHSNGRAYDDKKTRRGKTPKEALRALNAQRHSGSPTAATTARTRCSYCGSTHPIWMICAQSPENSVYTPAAPIRHRSGCI